MERIRAPFLIAALACAAIALAIELGTGALERFPALAELLDVEKPPGIGIASMALVDTMLVFTLALIGASLVVPHADVGRVQGCATVIASCLVLLASMVAIFAALSLLLLMVGLIASFFGIAIYLAVFVPFPHGTAAAILATLLTLKLATGVLLFVAHQGFVQATGLLALVATSIVLNLVIAFVHDLVPGLIVSIADAFVAIVYGIVAVIWAVILLVGGVIGVVTAIRPPSVGGDALTR
jgi:hypothetical protein